MGTKIEDNQGKSLEDAIKCWKYKKQLQGHNHYEKTDLIAIEWQSQFFFYGGLNTVNAGMLMCIACSNGSFEYRIKPSK